jgi:hypothetical protein
MSKPSPAVRITSAIVLFLKLVLAAVVIVFVYQCTTISRRLGAEPSIESSKLAPIVPATAAQAQPPAPLPVVPRWERTAEIDDLTKKETVYLSLQSSNQLELKWPYVGRNFGRLTLRQSPRFGQDLYIEIERGQFVCGVSSCAAQVVFDDGKPQQFWMRGPADHSSTVLFFQDRQRFISQASKATQIRVALTVYQAGSRTLDFISATPLTTLLPPKR